MALVLAQEVRIVRHDPTAVNVFESAVPPHGRYDGSVLGAAVLWVAVTVGVCSFAEGCRKSFGAFSVLHAHALGVEVAAGAVNHVSLDEIKELGIFLRVRDLGRYELVNVVGRARFVGCVLEDDEDVNVRQASLLVFDRPGVARDLAEDVALKKVLDKFFQLQAKDACDEVRAVGGILQGLSVCILGDAFEDLIPAAVSGHGDKEVRRRSLAGDGHSVHVLLGHVAWAPDECGWQNDGPSSLEVRIVSKMTVELILEVCVGISTQLLLHVLIPYHAKPLLFDFGEGIDAPLLEEAARPVKGAEVIVGMVTLLPVVKMVGKVVQHGELLLRRPLFWLTSGAVPRVLASKIALLPALFLGFVICKIARRRRVVSLRSGRGRRRGVAEPRVHAWPP